MKYLRWFLVLVPAVVAAHLLHAPAVMTFVLAALALVPLSGVLGEATEQLAAHVGESWGGLLNATFGNLAELIIVVVAIKAGETELVRASLIGSVLGNLLLILGASLVAGGARRQEVTFRRDLVGPSMTNLFVALTAMAVPTLVHFVEGDRNAEAISSRIAIVLIAIYLLSLLKHFRTRGDEATLLAHEAHEALGSRWSKKRALAVLAVMAIAIGGISEILVHHLEGFNHTMGWTPAFVGFVIVPLVGNISEHAVAIQVAAKGRMDLSLGVSIGSATQIALFVAPLAVFAGMVFGHPVTLMFTPIAMAFAFVAVVGTGHVLDDGRSDWLEGAQLLALYAIVACVAYYVSN